MKFVIYSNRAFERWDYNTPDTTGIGGSETAHIELAWRLARRGHEVVNYAPIHTHTDPQWRGTTWKDCDNVDWSEDGLWIIFRLPQAIDLLPKDTRAWLMCQDTHYPDATDEQVGRYEKVIGLCEDHVKFLELTYPSCKGKTWKLSNGVRSDLIRKIEQEGIERNNERLVYASSIDRGLEQLLSIFKRAREWAPNLTLDCYYGTYNLDKLSGKYKRFAEVKERVEKLSKQSNVTMHGRVNQPDLIRAWFGAGIFDYPTNFTETSCISVMEAQACGAFPISTPLWGVKENLRFGSFICGDPAHDPLTRARHSMEIVRVSKGDLPRISDGTFRPFRDHMMSWVRMQRDWDRVVDSIEHEVLGFGNRGSSGQYNFQLRHLPGKAFANLGCDVDTPKLKQLGAVNVDILEHNPAMRWNTAADYICDIRKDIPRELEGRLDGAVLGDILEHMTDDEAVACLKNAKRVRKNGGDIVITVPDDRRGWCQHAGLDEIGYKGHSPVPYSRLTGWLEQAGLRVKKHQQLEYGFAEGHGVVCC